ncbi:MAG: hypothetical protein IPI32_13420 [Austwickia sp.]|jgi:hypothetical protein|nr:hypothetical protein [Austwickia sp.]MBK8435229.1 hypothetical protein [Austwickia sp.]MBK9101219.1 hypothetical protein [Austwickia sp.]
MLYAATPGRRARQLLADLAVAAWVFGWIQAGRWVHDMIATLAGPTRELHEAGVAIGAGLRSAGGRVGEVPLVGDLLGDTFRQLAGAGDQVSLAGTSMTETIHQIALTLALLTTLGPILSVAIPWLVVRVRFVRRSRAARLLAGGGSGTHAGDAGAPNLELFALRALSHQPLTTLARIDPDPVGAWRRGDPDVTRELATLELRAAGLALPRAAGARMPRDRT